MSAAVQINSESAGPGGGLWGIICRCVQLERRWVILTPVLSIVAMVAYLRFAPAVYPIRGGIDLRVDSGVAKLAASYAPPAVLGTGLIDAVSSVEVLSDAVRRTNGSQYAILGTEGDPVRILREQLHVNYDSAIDRLTIRLDSPFPHQGAAIVNAVIESLLTPHKSDSGALAAAMIDPRSVVEVDSATADVEPLGLPPWVMISLSAVIGLSAGIAIALYRGVHDQRIHSPGQIKRVTGLRTAGYLPLLSSKLSPAGRGLAAHIDPNSEVAVLCRSLLLKLFGATVSQQAGSLLVTSPAGGEGRSTVALNLAVTLALAGESVLLVDADIQSPILHKLFTDSDSSLGLCEALDNPRAASDFVRPTHVQNLSLLSCGKASSAAAAKLQSQSLADVMSKLRANHRYVIYDAGPVLGNPDTLAVASRCNATLLVFHAQRTDLASAAEARHLLKQNRTRQVVAILNALPNDGRRKYFKNQPAPRESRRAPNETYSNIHDYGLVTS
jgi:capsular exopolysaccharide synthesis family protein